MARNTISYYYNLIADEANNQTQLQELAPNPDSAQTFLADLETPSKVAEHRLCYWVMAVLSWVVDGIFNDHKTEVEQLIEEARFGTLPWFKSVLLAFQYGDSIEWLSNSYGYSIIDETKQIVKYADANLAGRLIVLKAAKQVNEAPSKLDTAEKDALETYVKKLQPPGVTISLISYDPDLLKLAVEILYNPQLLKSTGESINEAGTYPVQDAINNYLNSIEFSDEFDTVSFIDALQEATGVVKPYILSAEGKSATAGSYTTISRTYSPEAGYMILDPVNPVSITYTPY